MMKAFIAAMLATGATAFSPMLPLKAAPARRGVAANFDISELAGPAVGIAIGSGVAFLAPKPEFSKGKGECP